MMTLATPSAGALRRLLCALALIVPVSPALAEEFSVTSGLSAHWFNPDRSGEGLVLEILSDDAALLYWFTYDEDGNQRWLIDVGEISGDAILFPELTVTRGGRFGPNFNPDDVEYEVVGEAILSFSDCDHGEFSYSAFGQSETIPVVRLSQTMAAGCQPIHGVPGQPVREYAGQSGSWYDPTHSGEGYTLQWMSRDEALLIWFSYDAEGNQYWMIGTGTYDDGQIKFPMLHSTQGGRFGSEFDPDDVESIEWGALTLEIGCDGGTAHYESEISGFGSGALNLDRLTQMSQPGCPYEAPKLTDLFEFDYREIEIIPGPPSNPNRLRAQHLAKDGTVIAFDGFNHQIKIHRPGAGDWTVLGEGVEIATGAMAFLSDDASRVVAVERLRPAQPVALMQWQPNTGWGELPNLSMRSSSIWGASRSLDFVVGYGRFGSEPELTPFIWDAERGQRELPAADGMADLIPFAVAEDGRTVVGIRFVPRPGGAHTARAVRWVDEGEPQVLTDPDGIELAYAQACSADCEVIFGMDQFEPADSSTRQAFYLTKSGEFQYLGRMDDAIEFLARPPYRISSASADGTIAVGGYVVELAPNSLAMNGLIWTQVTGLVPVRELLAELGLGGSNWGRLFALRITASGNKILLEGDHRHSGDNRTAILSLQPRGTLWGDY